MCLFAFALAYNNTFFSRIILKFIGFGLCISVFIHSTIFVKCLLNAWYYLRFWGCLSVPNHLLEFAQVHVHWISDVIQPSHPLLLLPSIVPTIRVFSNQLVFSSGGQSIGASASTSVLPVNIQGWFLLGLTGLISLQSKRLSRVISSTTLKASILHCLAFLLVQLSDLYMTTGKNIALTIQTFVGIVMSFF